MSSLLDPEFCRQLARLRLRARRRFAGSAGGARQSRRRGASPEFADHRPYYPGDDVRRIDWNAYARLEELVLRLYVAEEDLSLHLLVDRSRSMSVGDPSKLEVAKRLAATLSFVALSGNERVSVVPFAASVDRALAPTRGHRRIGAVLRYLDALASDGETVLSRSVDRFLAQRPRPGLAVVVSDLLDPDGYERPLDRLMSEGHEVTMFHVLDASELAPPERGDFVLVDSERGRRVSVSIDARALAAYQARLTAFLGGAEAYARRRGVTYLRIEAATLQDVVLAYLRSAA